jgi:hypothetical protein
MLKMEFKNDNEKQKSEVADIRNQLRNTLIRQKYPSEKYFAVYDLLLLLAQRFPDQIWESKETKGLPSSLPAIEDYFVSASGEWYSKKYAENFYNDFLKKKRYTYNTHVHDVARLRKLFESGSSPLLPFPSGQASGRTGFSMFALGMIVSMYPAVYLTFHLLLAATLAATSLSAISVIGLTIGMPLLILGAGGAAGLLLYLGGNALWNYVNKGKNEIKDNAAKASITKAMQWEENILSAAPSSQSELKPEPLQPPLQSVTRSSKIELEQAVTQWKKTKAQQAGSSSVSRSEGGLFINNKDPTKDAGKIEMVRLDGSKDSSPTNKK